jgi:arginyl-tRNA synthetase
VAGDGGLGEAVGWAGEDAVRFAVALVAPGRPVRLNMRDIATHRMDNPAYAVRYAHSRAASVPRWAMGEADPMDLSLAYRLSWLPERVAIAARRRRPDEFARYLADLADGIIRQIGPASNLELAAAARTGVAAGLGLLGITAPDRL